MKKTQFETYRFSINTQMKLNDTWYNVTEVNFGDGYIGVDSGYYLKCEEYEDVREKVGSDH